MFKKIERIVKSMKERPPKGCHFMKGFFLIFFLISKIEHPFVLFG
jgi:hypothetical protein